MFNISMSIAENFASFHDPETDKVVYVDSFDNRQFNVRFGTIDSTIDLGMIEADSDDVLNRQLRELVQQRILSKVK